MGCHHVERGLYLIKNMQDQRLILDPSFEHTQVDIFWVIFVTFVAGEWWFCPYNGLFHIRVRSADERGDF